MDKGIRNPTATGKRTRSKLNSESVNTGDSDDPPDVSDSTVSGDIDAAQNPNAGVGQGVGIDSAPGAARTHDLPLRRRLLYPTELRAQTKSVTKRQIFTYFIQGERGGPIKIGRATDVQRRLKDLQAASPLKLVVRCELKGDKEQQLHAKFSAHRLHGEWFKPCESIGKFVREHGGNQIVHLSPEEISDWLVDLSKSLRGEHIELDRFDDWANEFADELEAGHEDTDECECDSCAMMRAWSILKEHPEIEGYFFRERDWMLCAFVKEPPRTATAQALLVDLVDAFSELDQVGITLGVILYTLQGGWRDGQLLTEYHNSLASALAAGGNQ